jgi:hypothetical protein
LRMAPQHDYSETRDRVVRAAEMLDSARRAAGFTNLPPTMHPGEIRAQIDHLEALVAQVAEELVEAREACARAGRRGLTVCS